MTVFHIAFDSEEMCIRMASALADKIEVHLMLPTAGSRPFLKWLSPGVSFVSFDKPRLRQPIKQVRTVGAIIRRIRSVDPDIIHFHKAHLWFFLLLPALRRFPLVISVHDPVPHLGDAPSRKMPVSLIHRGYRRATRIIVHNEAMAYIAKSEVRIPTARIDVVPLIERGDRSLAMEVHETGNEILFFGRIWPYKGLEYLIQAVEPIAEQFPPIKVVVAGTGENIDKYTPMMINPDRFEIHNTFVSEAFAAELFRRSSVVVLPYIEATQSAVIPTAYTFGRPVVASAVGGLPSQVDDGKTGVLVPPADVPALVSAIVRLMSNPTKRREMGRNGQAKADSQWNAKAVADRILETYRRIVPS